MQYLYKDKTDYLLSSYKQNIEFKRLRVQSQLDSVRKRNSELAHDILIYLAFFSMPVIGFVISYLLCFSGHLLLNIVFVPVMFICAAAFIILGPFSAYKFSIHFLMLLFNRHGGSASVFGSTLSVYTYRAEENYCMGKLRMLDEYLSRISLWQKLYADGGELPDDGYMQNHLERLDLNFEIKVASVNDPIIKRIGWLGIPIMYLTVFLIALGVWVFDIFTVGHMLDGLISY